MEEKSVKKTLTGTIVSAKAEKTRVIVVESLIKHPIYGKYIKTRKKMMVHDADNKSKVGDKVFVAETRPISKGKRWTIVEVAGKSE